MTKTNFELEPGMLLMLDPTTPAIYLGPGGSRDAKPAPLMVGSSQVGITFELSFNPIQGEQVAWWYKTEWYVSPIERLLQDYPQTGWRQGWSSEAALAVFQRQRYVDAG